MNDIANDLKRLIAIEEIKRLKARYFYGIDNKDWDLWRNEVWAPDARLVVGEMGKDVGPRDVLVKVMATTVSMALASATSRQRSKMCWCPRWMPSKFPIVRTVRVRSVGTSPIDRHTSTSQASHERSKIE